MLNILKYANTVYNLHRYEIECKLSVADFYKTKFQNDHYRMERFCSLIYKKLF